ncbi:TfoX/Sxy family protein [Actinotalea solisilvae]|uniref:TfoX/Sxy family protein n=1 Tax=Actinotalea solisilvae TaxID=2072922 RepID=UPI0018F1FCF1|nr:TfoX/Sxy family protein [Actinotalea solisilvae]
MAYDVELADRIRDAVEGEPGVVEKRMFGGLAFLVDGSLAVSASGRGGMLLRVRPDEPGSIADDPRVEPFVMRGRAMAGWLHVPAEVVADDDALRRCVAEGVATARSVAGS